MHEYDSTLKLLLQGRAELSLRELTGVSITRWLNVELPEIGNRRADLLGETDRGELIHIELQNQNDIAMPLRMAEYCLRIYRTQGKFPRQIVLYVGVDRLRMKAELVGPRLSFRYDLIDIRDMDGEALMASDRLGDNDCDPDSLAPSQEIGAGGDPEAGRRRGRRAGVLPAGVAGVGRAAGD